MKTFIAISVFVATLITAVPVSAADQNGQYITIGLGLQVCSSQLTANGLTVEAINWFAGYLSSFNRHEFNTFDITGEDDQWPKWFIEYCRLNPVLTLSDAAKSYIKTAYGRRLIEPVPTITPPLGQSNPTKNRGLTKDRNRY